MLGNIALVHDKIMRFFEHRLCQVIPNNVNVQSWLLALARTALGTHIQALISVLAFHMSHIVLAQNILFAQITINGRH